MRKIILDTETTGLDFRTGDRLVEIGCVEMIGRQLSGVRFHRYLNPEREVPPGATAIHGLTTEFLADKPKFAEIVDEFMDFVRGAEIIIHNAAFDVGFLNNELALLQKERIEQLSHSVTDTLRMAREMRPGKKNNLNALCSEFGIDNASRTLHGALLDAELLAEVYIDLIGARQSQLVLAAETREMRAGRIGDTPRRQREVALAPRLTDADREAHRAFVATLGDKPIWSDFLGAG